MHGGLMNFNLNKIFKIIYTILIILIFISWRQVRKLPPPDEISHLLLNEPIQLEGTNKQNFNFAYHQQNYNIEPLADYELWGLVVSKNNINSWYNLYHDKNSVNLQDLCVVWGDNVQSGAYYQKNIKFSSGEWTCYYRSSGRMDIFFNHHQLSNNHLLASSSVVQRVIRSVNVGDQIYLKGALIDYSNQGDNIYRRTSLSRTDSNKSSRAGGACEIMFVDEIEVIKKNKLFWNKIYHNRWSMFYVMISLHIVLLIKNYYKK